jgi:NAD(P)H-flavin reductase
MTLATPPCEPGNTATQAAASPWRFRAARIARIQVEAPGVKTYRLEPTAGDGRPWPFAAGQFNMLLLPGIGEAALSITSDPATLAGPAHTVRAVGAVTGALDRLRVGDEILVRGPFGRPWPLDGARDGDLVLVAGGLGIASLLAAVHHCLAHRGDYGRITVLHGAKTPADLVARREHGRWRGYGIDVHAIVAAADAGWSGPVGLVTDLLDRIRVEPPGTTVFCCGPEPMMAAVAEAAHARGIPPHRIFLSIERLMGCAGGLCGLCQLGPFFVCRDGPVFALDRIGRWLAVPGL